MFKGCPGFGMSRSQVLEPEPDIEVLPAVELRANNPFVHCLYPNRSQILTVTMKVRIKQSLMDESLILRIANCIEVGVAQYSVKSEPWTRTGCISTIDQNVEERFEVASVFETINTVVRTGIDVDTSLCESLMLNLSRHAHRSPIVTFDQDRRSLGSAPAEISPRS